MLSIGDFARFAGVSVRMLRHYDSLGLLSPSRVDPHSGYRFYEPALLARADALVAFRSLGFSLEEVADLLDEGRTPAELATLLHRRRDELRSQIEADGRRLGEVERRLRLLEGDAMSTLTYTEKPLAALTLTQLTDHVDEGADVGQRVGPLFGRVYDTFEAAGIEPSGPAIGWYDAVGDGMTFGAGADLGGKAVDGLEVGTLRAYDRAVTAIYRGPMTGIGEAWQELSRHVSDAGLEFAGPCREIYLEMPEDQEGWVTELQQPVR
ncbi:MerR family transcriptional regulator [Nocardioides sp. NPDC057577]|uniref:MerR family transcriptional regulator n=1 Tax=Nocardioides sp. NPDC057577 TaxID=3346171 RepID=UPI00366ECB67